jgi:hypothetical protein
LCFPSNPPLALKLLFNPPPTPPFKLIILPLLDNIPPFAARVALSLAFISSLIFSIAVPPPPEVPNVNNAVLALGDPNMNESLVEGRTGERGGRWEM